MEPALPYRDGMLTTQRTHRTIRTLARRILAGTVVAAGLLGGLVAGSTPTAEAASPRSRTVLLVHGMPGPADVIASRVNCKDAAMAAWKSGLTRRGFTSVLTVGYNGNDYNCDLRVPGIADNTMNTSLDEVAREFANLVWNNYTSRGVPVAISAHSMGGLVVRRAITGVMNHDAGFPAYLYVPDVTTSGTPHFGATVAVLCAATINLQCLQMAAGVDPLSRHPFIWALDLYGNPQADSYYGTDWTLIGSWCDEAVGPVSSRRMVNSVRTSRIAGSGSFLDVRTEVFYLNDPRGCHNHLELITKPSALNLIDQGLTTYL